MIIWAIGPLSNANDWDCKARFKDLAGPGIRFSRVSGLPVNLGQRAVRIGTGAVRVTSCCPRCVHALSRYTAEEQSRHLRGSGIEELNP